MITYAQNFEDVILARALGDRRRGFYIDIGACFPDVASVTRHFYERGWSGINVEPMDEPFRRLCEARSRDLNLRAAIASYDGEIAIFPGASVGESSAICFDPGTQPVWVPCLTLAELCRRHVSGTIDFLKIDAEGLELEIIRSGDWRSFRPRIVVVEVSEPWSTLRRSDASEIDALLRAFDYAEAYYDGLNAFYVAREAAALASVLACPPNVLDGFQTEREAQFDGLATEAAANARRAEDLVGVVSERDARIEALAGAAASNAGRAEVESHRSEALDRQLREALTGWNAANASADAHARRVQDVASQLAQLEVRIGEMKREITTANRWAESAVNDLVRRLEDAEHRAAQAEVRARDAEARFAAIEASHSWRCMAPLRKMLAAMRAIARRLPFVRRVRSAGEAPGHAARHAFRAARRSRVYARLAPTLRRRFPGLWLRARRAFTQVSPSRVKDSMPALHAPRLPDPNLPASEGEPEHASVAGAEARPLTPHLLGEMIRREAARQR